jgi:zinc D-Ala-D-Ala carboxypeptidase
MNWSGIKWVAPWETVCRCGCGKNDMQFQVVDGVSFLRDIMGVRFLVTSGFRCDSHNRKVGGHPNSFHTKGKAIDFTVDRKELLPLIYRIAIVSKRFNGIGLGEKMIHVDCGDRPSPYYYIYTPGGIKPLCPDILSKIRSETLEEHLREYKV